MTQSTEYTRYTKNYKTIFDKRMAYIDVGSGDPIVFLHGNPTSSFLWRNIMPYLEGKGRLIAPDLLGMGDSDKLDKSDVLSYSFLQHRQYLYGLLDELGVDNNVIFVVHDWGSSLGFHWAQQNPDAVKGLVFMESIVAPFPSLLAFPESARSTMQAFRSPEGEEMALEQNVFVEQILPATILRDLTDVEMAEYRRPFFEPGESRRPTLSWPRQIPIAGEPAHIAQLVGEYSQWLAQSEVPKLFINAEPGAVLVGELRDFVRTWHNLTEVTVPGIHFIQEDSPDLIGEAIYYWLEKMV